MSFSDAFSALRKVRRVIAVISILASAAGYKFGPSAWHKFNASTRPVPANLAGAAGAATNSLTAGLPANDFGEVTLTNHCETSMNLGHGRDCRVVPKVIDDHNVELTLSLESRTAQGAVQGLTVAQVTAKTGKPLEIALGDYQLTFTPKIGE